VAPVLGDQNRLQQVMWNLLSNAIKFTPKGGLIRVGLERVESQIEMSVCDSGEGITPEFLPHVFDRFRQADASSTRRYGGLGIGLAIVKHLTELHGGSIRVESAGKGQGSTFTVSLPVRAMRAQDDAAFAPRRSEPSPALAMPDMSDHIAGVKVLVVDDEADSRALVRRLLEDCNARVTTASSANEALELTMSNPPDLIISDIGMPGEDGYSLIRRLRGLGPERGGNIPAIALTAYARSQDRMQSVLAGYQMHIPKPVEPAELITMVASLAGRTGA
jgi:CheY-like chemotaxis protein